MKYSFHVLVPMKMKALPSRTAKEEQPEPTLQNASSRQLVRLLRVHLEWTQKHIHEESSKRERLRRVDKDETCIVLNRWSSSVTVSTGIAVTPNGIMIPIRM